MIAVESVSIRRLVQDATARFCAGADLRARYSSSSDLQDRIDAAASSTDTEPSPAEIEAGNYQKGKFWVWGLQVTIETPAGTTRSGTDRNGKEWSHRLPYHYGYIRRTKSAADGDQVDVFIGPDPASEILFVVDQQTPGGRFDEHKVMLGWTNEREAKQAYLDSYTPGWQGFGGITAMTVPDFVEWLDKGDTGKRVAQYALAAAMVDEMVARYAIKPGKGQRSLFDDAGGKVKDPEFERKHPRGPDGEFTSSGGGGGSSTRAEVKESSKPEEKPESNEKPAVAEAAKTETGQSPAATERKIPKPPLGQSKTDAQRDKATVDQYASRGDVDIRRAKWGGEVSDIDGQFYKGGLLIPVKANESEKPSGKAEAKPAEQPKPAEPAETPAPKPDQIAEPGKKPEAPQATNEPEPVPPTTGPNAADPVNEPNLDTEANSTPDPVSTEDPREAATKQLQRALDANYAFARASSVPNAGEDLLGSARHKANLWTTLEAAEKNGSAAELVTRDNLLKNEPHNLLSLVQPHNCLSALAMHLAMGKFPAKPFDNEHSYYRRKSDEQKAKYRADYVAAYRAIKDDAENIARIETDPLKALKSLSETIRSHIQRIRESGDRYDPVANGLAGMYSNTIVGPYGGRGKLHAATQAMDFAKRLKGKYGDGVSHETLENAAGHVRDVIEGDSFNKTFGTVGQKGRGAFNPADLYVKYATRHGGRDVLRDTAGATKHMLETVKIRGIQWGNYVTDDERKHHLTQVSGAFADLADVMGLRPEDMSLDGALGLAIGARGHAGALAHYEPDTKVINLTRKGGVGALAHEWGHMFDHSLAAYKHYRSAQGLPGAEGADDPMHKAFSGLRKAMASCGFEQRMRKAVAEHFPSDASRKKRDYWTSPHEVFARAFESHVDHTLRKAGRVNTYLAGMLGHEFWPTKEESEALAPHFDAIAAAYRLKKYGTEERQSYSRAAMIAALAQQFEIAMYGQLSLFKEDDHPRDAGGKFSTKTGGGKTVNFVPHPHASKEHETVMVDTESLDKAWKAGGLHIPPGGEEIAGRRAGVEKFLQTGKPVQAPKVYVQPNGSVVFGDGRHRFAVLRDSGAKQVAVTLDKGSAGKIGKGSATAEKPRPELVQAMNAAVQQHIAKQPSPPPAIEGMQKSLFGGGDLRTGQKSLFNVALPPKKPAKPAERPAAGGPAQINPLDQLVPQQEPSLPGQRSLYQQIHADFLRALYDFTNAPEHPPQSHTSHQPPRESSNEGKHAAGWKKVGGSSVHVNSNGTIDAGCPGLKGEEVEDLIDEPDESRERREHRQAQAESRGIKGHEITAKQARALEGGERKQQAWQRMKELARQHGVSASRVMQHVGDVLQSHQEYHADRESGKKLAREMAGMTAGDAARLENSGRDWSSMLHFDEAADEFINNQPHLGIRDPQEFWDFIREGARPVPQAWHDAVMQEAAQRAAHSAEQARRGRPRSTAEIVGDAFDDWQHEKNGTSFDPSQFDPIPAGVDDDVPL